MDLDLDVGVGGFVGDGDGSRDVGETASDLGDHEVAADELDGGVRGVDGVRAGDGDLSVVSSTENVDLLGHGSGLLVSNVTSELCRACFRS